MNLKKLLEEKVERTGTSYLGAGRYVAQIESVETGDSPKSGDPRCVVTVKILESEGTDEFKPGSVGAVMISLKAGANNKMNRDRYRTFLAAAAGIDTKDLDAVNSFLGTIKDLEKFSDGLVGKKVAINVKQAFGKGGPIFTKTGKPFTNADFFAV